MYHVLCLFVICGKYWPENLSWEVEIVMPGDT